MKKFLLLLPLAASAWMAVAPAHAAAAKQGCADLVNEWDIPHLDPATQTVGPWGMEFDFAGNATGFIPAQVLQDPITNPFWAWQNFPGGGAQANPTNVSYDGQVTRVRLSGGPLAVPAVANGTPGWGGPGHQVNGQWTYHFGMNQGYINQFINNPLTNKRWIWRIGHHFQYENIPIVNVITGDPFNNQQGLQTARSAIVSLQTATTGTWTQACYQQPADGSNPHFVLTNGGVDPLTITDAAIITGLPLPTDKRCAKTPRCTEYQTELDALNDELYGMPDQGPSKLVPLPEVIGRTLAPGESITITAP
jgi:hypothetical protein